MKKKKNLFLEYISSRDGNEPKKKTDQFSIIEGSMSEDYHLHDDKRDKVRELYIQSEYFEYLKDFKDLVKEVIIKNAIDTRYDDILLQKKKG